MQQVPLGVDVVMTSILLVEDNETLAFGLRINLESEGYGVDVAGTAAAALQNAANNDYCLIILDLKLPDASGHEVLMTLRSRGSITPILVLSACSDEIDIVACLRSGAVDFLAKPFSLLELIERIRLRILPKHSIGATGLEINQTRRQVNYQGRAIKLAPKEFDLLCELINAKGEVRSRSQLLQNVWNAPPNLDTRTVEFHARSLRKKLAAAGVPSHLRIVHGRGMAWDV